MSHRRLWLSEGEVLSRKNREKKQETYEEIFDRFAVQPRGLTLLQIVESSHVVGQELVLTCLFLAGHRAVSSDSGKLDFDDVAQTIQPSLILVWLAFFLVILHNQPAGRALQARQVKIRHRSADGLFMAIALRYLAGVLKTLTASYSTDTVHALALFGFLIHLLACDYSYANGGGPGASFVDTAKRPAFEGGTLSLTAAFFATALLASRLKSNMTVYIFVSSSVVLFALYPAARHQVAINTEHRKPWVPLAISSLLTGATISLLSPTEAGVVGVSLCIVCLLVPLWKYILQSQKSTLIGPWILVRPTANALFEESSSRLKNE